MAYRRRSRARSARDGPRGLRPVRDSRSKTIECLRAVRIDSDAPMRDASGSIEHGVRAKAPVTKRARRGARLASRVGLNLLCRNGPRRIKKRRRAYGAVTPGVIGARVGGNARLPGTVTLPLTMVGQVSLKVTGSSAGKTALT